MLISKTRAQLLLALLLAPFALHAQELLYQHPISPEWARFQPLSKTLQELAGDNAERCGNVPVGHNPQPWTDCAQKAFREKRAFYVRYDVNSSAHSTWEFAGAFGIASDGSGLVYQVEYWTYRAGEFPPATPLVADESLSLLLVSPIVKSRLCPSPVRLRLTKYGALTCFASEPLSEILPPPPTPQF